MPIKTTITADADPTALKASLALLDKYQAALKALYGRDVLKAPHIAAVSTAARDIFTFMKNHEAAAELSVRHAGSIRKIRAARRETLRWPCGIG